MMQSNADFIKGFSEKAFTLRKLTEKGKKFKWEEKHDRCFHDLIKSFREDILLRYFDPSLNSYIVVDGHISGLGAILTQGKII